MKDWYFNPFSHDNISTPIFKRELAEALALMEKLHFFEFHLLLPAGEKLFFNFDDGAGHTVDFKIELLENLRWVESKDGTLLNNPRIRCYGWTENGSSPNPAAWEKSLKALYNAKLKSFVKDKAYPDVEESVFWTEIHQLSTGKSLGELI